MKRRWLAIGVAAALALSFVVWYASPLLKYRTIHEAAQMGDSAAVEWHLRRGVEVDAGDLHGITPLFWASGGGFTEVVELLCDHGADVNARQPRLGSTPLHWAAQAGRADVVALLLTHGAQANAKTIKGETPLRWAVGSGHTEVVELLRQHGGKK